MKSIICSNCNKEQKLVEAMYDSSISKWYIKCEQCNASVYINIESHIIPDGTKIVLKDYSIGTVQGNDEEDSELYSNINYYVVPIGKIFDEEIMLRPKDFRILTNDMEDNFKRLDVFKYLPKNWNGFDAEKYNIEYINNIKKLVLDLNKQPDIFPLPYGVQFEYTNNENYLEFEVDKDSHFTYFSQIDGTDNEPDEKFKLDASALNNIISDFYKSL